MRNPHGVDPVSTTGRGAIPAVRYCPSPDGVTDSLSHDLLCVSALQLCCKRLDSWAPIDNGCAAIAGERVAVCRIRPVGPTDWDALREFSGLLRQLN